MTGQIRLGTALDGQPAEVEAFPQPQGITLQNPDKIRAIYAELRRTVGKDIPAGEVLRIANTILKSYARHKREKEIVEEGRASRVLISLPTDEAMGDGGWRILEFERRRQPDHDDLEAHEVSQQRELLRKLAGSI